MTRFRFFSCLLPCVLCFPGPAARAQEAEKPPEPTVFQQVFPQPTGLNGYEEIVMAGDLARKSKTIAAVQTKNATLAAKRRALAEPENVEALRLLRVGLAKPIHPPLRQSTLDIQFPEFAVFRQIARLLVVEQYVLLADGKTGAAIESLRDGLRLSALVKGKMIFGSLVGAAVDAVVLYRFAEHLDQLSARDCERLMVLARESLSGPDPAQAALETERVYALAVMEQMRGKPSDIAEITGLDEEDAEEGKEIEALRADPAAARAVIERLAEIINAHYAARIASLRFPPWKRPEPRPIEDDSLAGRTARSFLSVVPQAMTAFTRSQTILQLLGVHAAIRRFRWENGRLPESLADLRLGDLGIDPFTGQSLVYRRTGETTYELASAGPPKRDEEGQIVPGERAPVMLPPPPRITTP